VAGHVGADLGDDGPGGRDVDARDLIQGRHRLRERGYHLGDAVLDREDVGVDLIDVGEHPGQQERVMRGEAPDECLVQLGQFGAHPRPRQLRQRLRVAFPGDQGGHHRPPGDPEDVRGDHGQLDAGVFEQLLHPVLLPTPFPDQVDPVAGEVPQLPDRRRRHETRPEHAPLGDLAQPHRVQLVGLRPTG
jgi:hypothetical protein